MKNVLLKAKQRRWRKQSPLVCIEILLIYEGPHTKLQYKLPNKDELRMGHDLFEKIIASPQLQEKYVKSINLSNHCMTKEQIN